MDDALVRLVWQRADSRCEYCRMPQEHDELSFEIDHVIARQHSGPTRPGNLALACSLCNDSKNNRIAALDPVTGEVVRLFDPRHQVWGEHFGWSLEGDRILGLTPVGRATAAALNLNRPALVKARQAWVAVGWHPPKD